MTDTDNDRRDGLDDGPGIGADQGAQPVIHWTQGGEAHQAEWRSEAKAPPPRRVVIADDTMPAATAFRLACEGTALLWQGDYHNARQLLGAMARRIEARGARGRKGGAAPAPAPAFPQAFHLHRKAQAERARILGMLVLPVEAGHVVPLRRAPDVRQACEEAWGPAPAPYVVSLRELLGLIGAHEWRRKGVEVPALAGRIHPHYGVFSPVRGEYLDLIAQAPLPEALQAHPMAFDIGTGTGVIAAVLARRGVPQIVATDQDARALACARENLARLQALPRVQLVKADLYPDGRAGLVVCNPPWVPARANAPVEHAVYDPDSRMLKGFLQGLRAHLAPQGEGWLILSDLAEHLNLRPRDALMALFKDNGLTVAGRLDIRPRHPKARDAGDLLHAARKAEVTSLWRLKAEQA